MNKDLKKLEKKELYSLLLELGSLSKENAEFLKLRKKPDVVLAFYKKKIKKIFFSERINLREARKVVTNFKKRSIETEHLLELMVFYVETGVKIDNKLGDMYEAFYLSIESMFEQVIKTLNENPKFIPKFKQRLDWIIGHCCEGWGHKDALTCIYEELVNAKYRE